MVVLLYIDGSPVHRRPGVYQMIDPREVLGRMAKEAQLHYDQYMPSQKEMEEAIQAALHELFVAVDDERGYPTHDEYLLATARVAEAITELEL